jgi:DNA-directed RNA polymerase subunit F
MQQKLTTAQWETLSAWLDGELDAEQSRHVEEKLADDPVWAHALTEMQAVQQALDAWSVPPAPPELAERIARTCRNQPAPSRILRLALPLSAAAAAVVLIGVGMALLHNQPNEPLGQPVAVDPARPAGEPVPDVFVVEGVDVFSAANSPAHSTSLRERIEAEIGSSLRESIGHEKTAKQRWAELTGQQQDRARQHALAFLKLDPDEQQRLIDSYAQAVAEDPSARAAWQQRSHWLQEVLESFTPEQRDALRQMTPARRAETFIERRRELGLDAPTDN